MKSSVRLLLCFATFLSLASPAPAQKRRHRHLSAAWGAPEIFSDLFLEPATGDMGGMEVFLFPGSGGTWATLMIASGALSDPVLVGVNDDHYPSIEFTLPAGQPYGDYGKFTGRISSAGLTIWNRGERSRLLRRQAARP